MTELGVEEIAYRKWSLPVLAAAGDEGSRFSEIGGRLSGVTDRALSQALGTLEDHGLLARHVRTEERPPVAVYRSTGTGRRLRSRVALLLNLLGS